MKQSGLSGKSGSIDLQYRYKGLLISNRFFVDYIVSDRVSPYGSFTTYARLDPYLRVRDENGNVLRVLEYRYSWLYNGVYTSEYQLNPMYDVMYNQKNRSTAFEVRDALRAEYTLNDFRFALDVNISKLNSEVDIFKPGAHSSYGTTLSLDQRGSYDWSRNNKINWDINFSFSYNKMIGKSLIAAYGRFTMDDRYTHTLGAGATGFPSDQLDELFLGATMQNLTGSEGRSRSMGGVGTLSYSYDQRYAADFSVRMDASSEFGRRNRYAPFWSAGTRWNIHKEKAFATSKFINELVLRATYGITGTQGFSPYQSLQMYSYAGMIRPYAGSDVMGVRLTSIGNPNLQWQQTDVWNFGTDFNIWKGVLMGRFEYYYKYTKRTLIDFSLPPSVGFTTIADNMGNISNRGYEAMLRITPYTNLEKRLMFNIVINASHNKNRIEKISNALKMRNEESMNSVINRPLPRYEEGYSQSIIWAVRSLGIEPISGREFFLDLEGNQTALWNAADQVPVGDTEPKLHGTVAFNFNWKDFSLSVAGGYRFGGQVFNRTLAERVENVGVVGNVDKRAFTERWKGPGDHTYYSMLTYTSAGARASSRFVMDDDLFSINTINIQYRLEKDRHKFLRTIGVSNANVGLYLEDIVRFATVKMERGLDYPFTRQVSLSLSLIF